MEKRILIGINDDANVKVIQGLSPDDEVIVSIVKGTNKNSANVNDAQRSPFMPQMRRRPAGSQRN